MKIKFYRQRIDDCMLGISFEYYPKDIEAFYPAPLFYVYVGLIFFGFYVEVGGERED